MVATPRIDNLESSRNTIINGNFDMWQRGTSFPAIASGAYSADRFKYIKTTTGVVHTISQSSDVPTFSQSKFLSDTSILLTVTTADATQGAADHVRLQYLMEGGDYAPLHGRPARLQFWVKNSIPGVYSISFRNNDSNRSYVTSYTVNVANVWEFKSIDLTFDTQGVWLTSRSVGVSITFTLMGGTDTQTPDVNQWVSGSFNAVPTQTNGVATIGATFQLSQVALFPVNAASDAVIPFARAGKTFGEEFSMCERYYEKSYDFAAQPGTATNNGAMAIQIPYSASRAMVMVKFRTIKRSTPSVTVYGTLTGTAGTANFNATEQTASALDIGEGGFDRLAGTTFPVTQTTLSNFHFTADSEF